MEKEETITSGNILQIPVAMLEYSADEYSARITPDKIQQQKQEERHFIRRFYDDKKRTYIEEAEEEKRSLLESVKKDGIMQPIMVMQSPTNEKKYMVIDGNHRLAAIIKSGQPTAPCIMANASQKANPLLTAAKLNLARKNMTISEKYQLFKKLKRITQAENPDRTVTDKEIAEMLGYTPKWASWLKKKHSSYLTDQQLLELQTAPDNNHQSDNTMYDAQSISDYLLQYNVVPADEIKAALSAAKKKHIDDKLALITMLYDQKQQLLALRKKYRQTFTTLSADPEIRKAIDDMEQQSRREYIKKAMAKNPKTQKKELAPQ